MLCNADILFIVYHTEPFKRQSGLQQTTNFATFSPIFDIKKIYFFCGSFMFLFCLVFAMSLCVSVYMCFVVTCWERADLLALVCGVFCEFVTFPLVSWVRCGT